MIWLAFGRVDAANSEQPASHTRFVSVPGTSKELAFGYIHWLHLHPQMLPDGGPAGDAGAYKILWPTLDLYSADGRDLYHGNDTAKNIALLDALPLHLPSPPKAAVPLRPTLDEAEAMFPSLRSAKAIPSHPHPTLFVITYADRPECASQDAAVQRLKKRLSHGELFLIEVRIPPGG